MSEVTASKLSPELRADFAQRRADYENARAARVPRTLPPARYQQMQSRRDHAETLARFRMEDIVRAARAKGWPLTYVADALGVSPERARQMDRAPVLDPKPKGAGRPPKFPQYKRSTTEPSPPHRQKIVRTHLTPEEAEQLRSLSAAARNNTGSKLLDAEERKASLAFNALLIELRGPDRNVTWGELAEASGLRAVSVRMRLARHGHGSLPPSVPAYLGIVAHKAPTQAPATASVSKRAASKAPASKTGTAKTAASKTASASVSKRAASKAPASKTGTAKTAASKTASASVSKRAASKAPASKTGTAKTAASKTASASVSKRAASKAPAPKTAAKKTAPRK